MVKISVIVPVYNVEAYLDKCIESIVKQTYQNLEILLIDDGSPDRCPAMCDEWSKKDSRIRVIHQKNSGLSSARNAGISIASGDYIGFVDSDDYISSIMYEKMLTAIIEKKADLCICGIRWVDENGNIAQNIMPCPIKDELMDKKQAYSKLCEEGYCDYVTTVNKLYKKEIFDNLRFPEGRIHEDEFTIHHILNKCSIVVSIKEEFYYYVQHLNSITHSIYTVKHLDGAWALYDRYLFFKNFGFKKLAYYSLRQCYGTVILCIQNIDVIRNKRAFDHIAKKVVIALGVNIRTIKLLIIYFGKILRETAAFIKAKIYLRKSFLKKDRSEGTIVLMATPIHGNLGDHAIVYAESKLLHKIFPQKKIVEIPNNIFLRFPELIQQYIFHEDIIVIDGGGNLGTLWPHEDDKIREIIQRFRENQIVIFPQTCYYDASIDCKERLWINRKIYSTAQNLTIMLRDHFSYDFVCKEFPEVKSIFIPDIVLSIKPLKQHRKRKGVLLCFREDCEKLVDDSVKQKMIEQIQLTGRECIGTSTVVPYCIRRKTRIRELQKKWNEFSSAELIITDRLHAMIFAVITETPCIAIDNKSRKVAGSYEWIRKLHYIRYIQDVVYFDQTLIQELLDIKTCNNTFIYPVNKIKNLFRG